MPKPPVTYRDDLEEIDPEQEADYVRRIEKAFAKIVTRTHEAEGEAQRGVHAKGHAMLDGTFEVVPDLPPELAQGLFERPASYRCLLRFSQIPGDVLPDDVSLPRGVAIKLFGVPGNRLENDAGDEQDFLLANGPTFSSRDAHGMAVSLPVLGATTDRGEWAKQALSAVARPIAKGLDAVGLPNRALHAIGGYPARHPAGDRYFTQVPLRFGDHIAKFDLVPVSASIQALADVELDLADPDVGRTAMKRFFETEGGEWSFRAQPCRDLTENPIEDAAKEWAEDDNPYLPVATIRVGPQDSWSADREALEDRTTFRPWNGIEAHRPLGAVMRARRHVYPFVQARRQELNASSSPGRG